MLFPTFSVVCKRLRAKQNIDGYICAFTENMKIIPLKIFKLNLKGKIRSGCLKLNLWFIALWQLQEVFSQKIEYLICLLFTWFRRLIDRGQIRLLKSETTDLDWHYFRPHFLWKFLSVCVVRPHLVRMKKKHWMNNTLSIMRYLPAETKFWPR